MQYPNSKLIIFCKAPIPGQSKTRLIPALGEDGSAELHRRMSQHVIDMALQANLAEVELQCYPDSHHEFFMKLLTEQCIELNQQQGDDLGARMSQAFEQALSNYRNTIIIGTDAPIIDTDYLQTAFEQLNQGSDVVLGPAQDGGYVLIGLSRFDHNLFRDIDWGTERVYKQTLKRIKQAKLSVHELDIKWDVDTADDLLKIQKTPALSYLLNHFQTA